MKLLCSYKPYDIDEIEDFISTLIPNKNSNLKLIKGEEKYGWINLYFEQNNELFKITWSLAMNDLSELIVFFENVTGLKEDIAIFFDDESRAEPLLYISSINDENIRLLIADGKTMLDKWNNGEINDDEIQLAKYEIKCDVIINKKNILKDFCAVIENIVATYEKNEIYDIEYDKWINNFKNIILYCN